MGMATYSNAQPDERGKMPKPKTFKKETGIVNGMKVIEYGGINWLFETTAKNDYAGIQGFPHVSGGVKLEGTVNLPDAVIICHGFFTGSDMEKVILSPSIKTIADGAFSDCNKLTEIVFPEGCGDIEMSVRAFPVKEKYNGTIETNIKRITVPRGRADEFAKKLNLPEYLFEDGTANLERNITVEKPGTILNQLSVADLKKISSLTITGILDENDLKVIEGCDHLKVLDLTHAYTTLSGAEQKKRHAEQEFLQGMFQTMGELSEEKYKNGEIGAIDHLQVQLFVELAKDKSQIKNGSDGCLIPEYAFAQMKSLETVKLPYRATKIEGGAFRGCSNLRNVELPLYLKYIIGNAFLDCIALEELEFPATLEYIGMETFDGCTSLRSVDLSACTFETWRTKFKGCTGLRKICYPEGITSADAVEANRRENEKWVSPEYYFPKTLTRLTYGTIFNTKVHFKGESFTKSDCSLHGCEIYVKKGNMTSYYGMFNNNGNTFKEE